MVREVEHIDISDMPDLIRLAEEVARTQKPRLLTYGDEDLALLLPPRSRRSPKGNAVTDADIEAALAASWVGLVDPEKLNLDLDAVRGDSRPA